LPDDPTSEAERLFWSGLADLERSVALLRGPAVPASPGTMRTEQALTRAVDVLRVTGFRR
jgi:hypothetical protein